MHRALLALVALAGVDGRRYAKNEHDTSKPVTVRQTKKGAPSQCENA